MMNFANTFRRDGYLVIRNVFTKEEIAEMKAEIDIAARMQRHEDYIKIAAGGAITIEPLKDRVSETSQTLLENNFTENNNLVKASGVAQILPKYDPSEDDNLVKASGVAQILPKYDPSEDDNLVKASGVAQILPKYDPSEDDN
ncbi:phytanoyl-CoA dioxygenase family protein, partial [Cytobacillus purgationiresistens]